MQTLNYSDIIGSAFNFRQWSKNGEVLCFDQPGTWYFRPVFYFDTNQGLLGTSRMDFNTHEVTYGEKSIWTGSEDMLEGAREASTYKQSNYTNTAYNFLLANDELERAQLLKEFVNILSNINVHSPWYWQELSGLDSVLERKMFNKEFKIEEDRPKISIKCLPDAYDTRIGTLLDLYRAICWSYQRKREVLPVNLRRFDMGIFIFHAPVENMHTNPMISTIGGKTEKYYMKNRYARLNPNPKENDAYYNTSVKYIELTGCEIDMNSSKGPFGSLSNTEGNQFEYTIDISCDDAYEARYNEFIMRTIGDFVVADMDRIASSIDRDGYGGRYIDKSNELADRINLYSKMFDDAINQDAELRAFYTSRDPDALSIQGAGKKGVLSKMFGKALDTINNKVNDVKDAIGNMKNMTSNIINQGMGMVSNLTSAVVNKVALGNLWDLDYKDVADIARDLTNGNVLGMATRIHGLVQENKKEETTMSERLEGYGEETSKDTLDPSTLSGYGKEHLVISDIGDRLEGYNGIIPILGDNDLRRLKDYGENPHITKPDLGRLWTNRAAQSSKAQLINTI